VTRSRQSARSAGTAHETNVAGYLARTVDSRIERRARNGAKDRGDIAGLRTSTREPLSLRVVVECKDYGGRIEAGKWLGEAEQERLNDGAGAAIVVAKRRGTTDPAEQIVLMTLADLVALITEERP
jgi:hypothetical protein